MKKSYTMFVLSLVIYLVLLLAAAFLTTSEQIVVRLIVLLTVWYMAWLAFYVWRTEKVYLYNGTSFEEAVEAGFQRRKDFAWQHLRIFGMFALVQTVLTCAMHLLGWSAWIDFTVGMVGLIVAACRTIPFKL